MGLMFEDTKLQPSLKLAVRFLMEERMALGAKPSCPFRDGEHVIRQLLPKFIEAGAEVHYG